MKWRVLLLSNPLRRMGRYKWLRLYVEKTSILALAVFGSNRFSQFAKLVAVDVVIDVGAFKGLPDLHNQFTKSRFILVDPLQHECESFP